MTTNQTQRFCQSNPYWLAYLMAEQRCEMIWLKLLKSIAVHDKWNTDLTTLYKNERYYYAHRELKRKFKGMETHYVLSVDFPSDIRELKYSVTFSMKSDGRWVGNIYGAGTEDGWYNGLPYITGESHNHSFPFQGKLTKEEMTKRTIQEINKFLYATGKWREMQESRLWDKAKTKDMYKYAIKHNAPEDYVNENAGVVEAWVKRHFNIDISHVNINDGIKLANKIGKQLSIVIARKFDYSFMYEFDGDVDEAEYYFWEEMDQYEKNSILI